jgi:predicted component of type VI protein secretion system
MSNLHCKINQIQNVFLFEDIASTNGSWQRLSDESKNSEFHGLKEGMIFKIGNSAMYEVEKVIIENSSN